MEANHQDDFILVIILNIKASFDFLNFSSNNLQQLIPFFNSLKEIMLDTTNPPQTESLYQLIVFWNQKIIPHLIKFSLYPKLFSILEELNLILEKHQIKLNNNKQSLNYAKAFSTANSKKQSIPNSQTMLNDISSSADTTDDMLTSSTLFIDKENEIEVLDYSAYDGEQSKKSNNDDPNNNSRFNFGNNIKDSDIALTSNPKKIKFISIDFLIQEISKGGFINEYNDIVNGICLQHSIFIPTDVFLSKIISAFNDYYSQYLNSDKKDVEIHMPYDLISLLNCLIIHCHHLLISNTVTLETITQFLKDIISKPQIKGQYETMLISMQNRLINYKSLSPRFASSKGNQIEEFNLLAYTPKNIAQELSRVSLHLFNQIKPDEFFSAKFIKKDKANASPNIILAINRFNTFSLFMLEEILSYDSCKERANIICLFIEVAHELKEINNFNDCFNITSTFNHLIIRRLKMTWEQVPSKSLDRLNKLQHFISFDNNYQALSNSIAWCIKSKQLFIPYLGLYTKKICFIEEQFQYIKDKSLINCDKVVKVYCCLKEFFEFKQYKNNYLKIGDLEILQCLNPLNEEELERKAATIEPVFTLSPNKSKNKKRTHTDNAYNKAKF